MFLLDNIKPCLYATDNQHFKYCIIVAQCFYVYQEAEAKECLMKKVKQESFTEFRSDFSSLKMNSKHFSRRKQYMIKCNILVFYKLRI